MGAGDIGCGGGAPPTTQPDAQRATDAASSADAEAADAAPPADGAAALQPCFCNQAPDPCCEGAGTVKAGFECCWGTSC